MNQERSHTSSNTTSSHNGCWTCRLRRKKCDGNFPRCDTCTALLITCYNEHYRPDWMDGGERQSQMAEQVKREVKEKGHHRRSERAINVTLDRLSIISSDLPPTQGPRNGALATLTCDVIGLNAGLLDQPRIEPRPTEPASKSQRGSDCVFAKNLAESVPFGRSDTVLLMFYLEQLFPFLFPFYSPPLIQGGRAWILEMMLSSPVIRKATLCQSSYFYSIAVGTSGEAPSWETLLGQTTDAFEILRQALQIVDGPEFEKHLHGAVRTMASIMQFQCFESVMLSFDNCYAHLNAATALFIRIVGSAAGEDLKLSYKNVISRLGPPSWTSHSQSIEIPSAEQNAFRFSSSLLIFGDIIASTALQERPQLYEYHQGLLGDVEQPESLVDLELVLGCQNWALLHIGEISTLDAWKQQYKRAGKLDVMKMVHRATAIKQALETRLSRLEVRRRANPTIFESLPSSHSNALAGLSLFVTRIWVHAALIYLSVVVSGWQPASEEIRFHVDQALELLVNQIRPSSLLHTMVWPLCVIGCLARPDQELQIQGLVEALQPPSLFGSVRMAFKIMQHAWSHRDTEDIANRDLAWYFRSQGKTALLV